MLLPILDQETVLLDFDPYSLKTYNVMQAAIAINAIDSQRRDQVCLIAHFVFDGSLILFDLRLGLLVPSFRAYFI